MDKAKTQWLKTEVCIWYIIYMKSHSRVKELLQSVVNNSEFGTYTFIAGRSGSSPIHL